MLRGAKFTTTIFSNIDSISSTKVHFLLTTKSHQNTFSESVFVKFTFTLQETLIIIRIKLYQNKKLSVKKLERANLA